jgi:hypothetical protein
MALALMAAAPGAPAPPAWRLDVPVALVAQSPTSGVDTRVVPWFGVRAARLLTESSGGLLVLGGDVASWLGTGPLEGTKTVSASRLTGAIELRGLLGINAVQTAEAAIRPYGYLSALGGGALVTLAAYTDQSYRLLPEWGLGAGGGLEVRAHLAALRVELGGGLRDGGFALTSTLAAGVAF